MTNTAVRTFSVKHQEDFSHELAKTIDPLFGVGDDFESTIIMNKIDNFVNGNIMMMMSIVVVVLIWLLLLLLLMKLNILLRFWSIQQEGRNTRS